MSVEKKEDVTYELILKTARDLFFKEGRFNASTQEIADTAGVNRTLINYYFRSRDNLFDLVFEEAKKEEDEKQLIIIHSDLPIRQKLELYIDHFFKEAKEYPYKEIYIVTRMNQHPSPCLAQPEKKQVLESVYKDLQAEIEKGSIRATNPIHFMLNFISLISFPVGMRPLLQQGLELSDEEYDKILSERKEAILNAIFNY